MTFVGKKVSLAHLQVVAPELVTLVAEARVACGDAATQTLTRAELEALKLPPNVSCTTQHWHRRLLANFAKETAAAQVGATQLTESSSLTASAVALSVGQTTAPRTSGKDWSHTVTQVGEFHGRNTVALSPGARGAIVTFSKFGGIELRRLDGTRVPESTVEHLIPSESYLVHRVSTEHDLLVTPTSRAELVWYRPEVASQNPYYNPIRIGLASHPNAVARLGPDKLVVLRTRDQYGSAYAQALFDVYDSTGKWLTTLSHKNGRLLNDGRVLTQADSKWVVIEPLGTNPGVVLRGGSGVATTALALPGGGTLTVSDDGVQSWDASGALVATLEEAPMTAMPETYCALKQGGIAVGDTKGQVHIWNTAGSLIASFTAHAQATTSLIELTDGRLCTHSLATNMIRVWDVADEVLT